MRHDAALTARYETAAKAWPDKMRLLGYYDAYLGMISHWPRQDAARPESILDVGAGTAAMSEAWVAVHGAPSLLTLLDPSAAMLERGRAALARRSVVAQCCTAPLAPDIVARHRIVLAAHVLEHFADPRAALRDIAALTEPGGELWLVASKPHWCNAIIWLQWRHRTFTAPIMAEMLDAAGFDLRASYDFPSGPPSRTSRGYVAVRRD